MENKKDSSIISNLAGIYVFMLVSVILLGIEGYGKNHVPKELLPQYNKKTTLNGRYGVASFYFHKVIKIDAFVENHKMEYGEFDLDYLPVNVNFVATIDFSKIRIDTIESVVQVELPQPELVRTVCELDSSYLSRRLGEDMTIRKNKITPILPFQQAVMDSVTRLVLSDKSTVSNMLDKIKENALYQCHVQGLIGTEVKARYTDSLNCDSFYKRMD